MRSLLVQASSTEKAITKAWADAGMPTEFTIKILDFGQKGFFGITRKPSIVSILYAPQKQTSLSKKQPTRGSVSPADSRRRTDSRRPTRTEKPRIPRQQPHPSREKGPERQQTTKPREQKERLFWSDTLIYDITSWLTEILKGMEVESTFKVKEYKKALNITFDKRVLATSDDERLLFSGLSYLLIQFLKKKHKKKYQGYKLILSSKQPQ